MPGVLPVLLVAVALVVIGGWMLGALNGLGRLRQLVGQSWRHIDEELGRRHELIPGLVQTVRRYAPDDVTVAVAEAVLVARVQAVRAVGPAQRAFAESDLSGQLARLFALADGHSPLAADQDFDALAQELQAAEGRIAAGRRHYNAAAGELNSRVERFPTRLVARVFGIDVAEPFVVDLVGRSAGRPLGGGPPRSPA